MPRIYDLTGQRFGKLTVIQRHGTYHSPGGAKQSTWLCLCDCGNTNITTTGRLRGGYTKSCGCLKNECTPGQTHGLSKTPEHKAWTHMRARCNNPNNNRFKNYGARGIKVCHRWLNSFEAFYSDMGPRPSKKHSLDRIDNDGDYTPDNCRWATNRQQVNNMTRNVMIEYGGTTKTMSQWARHFGFKPSTLGARLRKGWPIEKALTTPVHN